jgi:hypothetical protein
MSSSRSGPEAVGLRSPEPPCGCSTLPRGNRLPVTWRDSERADDRRRGRARRRARCSERPAGAVAGRCRAAGPVDKFAGVSGVAVTASDDGLLATQ